MAEPKFRWNQKAGRYVSSSGRFLSRSQVSKAFNTAIDNSSRKMAQATVALKNGSTTTKAWHALMRQEVKSVHLYTGALSKGGWAQLSQADLGRIGQRVKEQYKALDNFAGQIASGVQPLDGRAVARSQLYGQSGRQTLHFMERAEQETRGFTEERCFLNGDENCSECIDEANRGWVPIGDLVPIGSRICNMNCRCEVEFR